MKREIFNKKNISSDCYRSPKSDMPFHHYFYTLTSDKVPSLVWRESGKNTRKKTQWRFNPQSSAQSISNLEKLFNQYTAKWRNETAAHSSTYHITRNDNYIDIIGMGPAVIPLILKELLSEADHWFAALKAVTKEDPVPLEHYGHIEKMRQDWLDWGRRKNII